MLDSKFPAIFLSAMYSFWLAFVLPLNGFKDRDSYLIYAERSWEFFSGFFNQSLILVFTNEPLFLFVNYFLSLFFTPDFTLRVLISIFSFLFAYSILSHNKKVFIWLLLLLFLPQVLKNNVMQLRQGYAVAIFCFAWLCVNGKIRWFLIALTPFMHASFFIVLFFLFWYRVFSHMKLSFGIRSFLVGAIAFGSSIMILNIAEILGARQGLRYSSVDLNVSGYAFLFWLLVFGLFLTQPKAWFREHGFPVVTLLIYLIFYFSFPLSGRIFESTLPLVFIAGFSMVGLKRYAFNFLFLFYFCYQYYVSVQQPFLGFSSST